MNKRTPQSTLIVLLVLILMGAFVRPVRAIEFDSVNKIAKMIFGEKLSVLCNNGRLTTSRVSDSQLSLFCNSLVTTPAPSFTASLNVDPDGRLLEGQRLSGKVAIQAKTNATNVSRVTFTLKNSSGVKDTHTEYIMPYYYKGDNGGNPYYWDTAGFSGQYVLSADVVLSDGQVIVASGTFTVGTGSVTPSPVVSPVTSPAPSPVVGGANPFCNDPSLNVWHSPGSHPCSYLKAGHPHEHGDAPPAWVTAVSGVSFMGMHNTSPVEDTVKHASMKGFATTMNGMDMYLIYHFTATPMERFGSYHSYQFWMRPAGDSNLSHVSYMKGWTFTGVPTGPGSDISRYERTKGDPGERPVILVVDRPSWDAGIRCEQWYNGTTDWSIDFGVTICNSPVLYNRAKEQSGSASVDAAGNYVLTGVFDKNNWTPEITGDLGLSRRLELAWYGPNSTAAPNRGNPVKDRVFYATQFGERVSGPTDARCSGTTVGSDNVTYKNICLAQYISSAARAIEFPGNAVQKTFPGAGIVQLPN